MSLLTLFNASLQTISTAFIVWGGFLIAEKGETEPGIILIIAGFIAYLMYELTPQK